MTTMKDVPVMTIETTENSRSKTLGRGTPVTARFVENADLPTSHMSDTLLMGLLFPNVTRETTEQSALGLKHPPLAFLIHVAVYTILQKLEGEDMETKEDPQLQPVKSISSPSAWTTTMSMYLKH